MPQKRLGKTARSYTRNEESYARDQQVLAAIIAYAQRNGGNTPSVYSLADQLGMKRDVIRYSYDHLRDQGVLTLTPDREWVIERSVWLTPAAAGQMRLTAEIAADLAADVELDFA